MSEEQPANSETTPPLFTFGLPANETAPAPAAPAETGETGQALAQEDDEHVEEVEVLTVQGWAPEVSLDILDTVNTGEEDEEEVYSQRSKLYRWATETAEWKERGLGDTKLLRNKKTQKTRLLLRQEKTGKIVANQMIYGGKENKFCQLAPNAGSEKCWVWLAMDCSEGEVQVEQQALKFGQVEYAQAFKTAFEEALAENTAIIEGEPAPAPAAATGETED